MDTATESDAVCIGKSILIIDLERFHKDVDLLKSAEIGATACRLVPLAFVVGALNSATRSITADTRNMASRTVILAILLGAALGGPYLISQGRRALEQAAGSSSAASSGLAQSDARPGVPGGIPNDHSKTRGGGPVYPLDTVLRMDVSKEWVYARWPRKSTGLSDPGLFGIRVPLVTGTSVHDVAGSLTYHFDPQGRVQHLSLRGRTGDTSAVTQVVTSRFGLRPESSPLPGERIYRLRQNGRIKSELRIQLAPVMNSSLPQSSLLVELELERPDSPHYLAPSAAVVLLPPIVVRTAKQEPVPVGPIGLLQKATDAWYGADSSRDSAGSTSAKNGSDDADARGTDDNAADKVEPPIHNRMRWPS